MIRLRAISSMATRDVLAELAELHRRDTGVHVMVQSVGGVEAARRVEAGEAFDLVVLAGSAVASLENAGHIVRGTRIDVAASGVAVAVRAGEAIPDLSSADAVRQAVLDAASIGYSTGPSGVHLARLFETWGIAGAIRSRTVQAPPGVPVGMLVASGEVALGFQQLSELIHLPGITVAGPLPADVQVTTVFAAGVGAASTRAAESRAWLSFIASPASAEVKRRHGMQPP